MKKTMTGFKKNKKSLVFILLIVVSVTVPVLARQEQQKEYVQVINNETAGTIELLLAFPQPGTWNPEVQLVDRITGQQTVKKAQVEIAAVIPALAPPADSEPDPALIALLAKGADYAEKLKKAAFHFICREEVTQEVFGMDEHSTSRPFLQNYWTYDYQIIGRDGEITETRVLLEKNRKKSYKEKAQLETAYRSFYSFYMPVTVLDWENQYLYQYRLLDIKKKIWHIAAVPNDPLLSIPWGEIWISEADGAVLKIQIEQNSVVGFEKLAEKIKKRGLVPVVRIILEYDMEKDQIRFPSKTTLIERYNSDRGETKTGDGTLKMGIGYSSFEHSRIYFEYKDYRFFSITTSVEEKIE